MNRRLYFLLFAMFALCVMFPSFIAGDCGLQTEIGAQWGGRTPAGWQMVETTVLRDTVTNTTEFSYKVQLPSSWPLGPVESLSLSLEDRAYDLNALQSSCWVPALMETRATFDDSAPGDNMYYVQVSSPSDPADTYFRHLHANEPRCDGVSDFCSAICSQKLDMVIVLDESGSISDEDYRLSLDFAVDVINSIPDISEDGVHIGFVGFSTYAVNRIDLGYNRDQILATLTSEAFFDLKIDDFTNTEDAITLAEIMLDGSRADVPDVVIVVTDGNPNTFSDGIDVQYETYSVCEPSWISDKCIKKRGCERCGGSLEYYTYGYCENAPLGYTHVYGIFGKCHWVGYPDWEDDFDSPAHTRIVSTVDRMLDKDMAIFAVGVGEVEELTLKEIVAGGNATAQELSDRWFYVDSYSNINEILDPLFGVVCQEPTLYEDWTPAKFLREQVTDSSLAVTGNIPLYTSADVQAMVGKRIVAAQLDIELNGPQCYNLRGTRVPGVHAFRVESVLGDRLLVEDLSASFDVNSAWVDCVLPARASSCCAPGFLDEDHFSGSDGTLVLGAPDGAAAFVQGLGGFAEDRINWRFVFEPPIQPGGQRVIKLLYDGLVAASTNDAIVTTQDPDNTLNTCTLAGTVQVPYCSEPTCPTGGSDNLQSDGLITAYLGAPFPGYSLTGTAAALTARFDYYHYCEGMDEQPRVAVPFGYSSVDGGSTCLFGSGFAANQPAGTVEWVYETIEVSDQSFDTVHLRAIFSPRICANVYQASGAPPNWPQDHTFLDMRTSDFARFQLYDTNNNVILSFEQDYISDVGGSTYRSAKPSESSESAWADVSGIGSSLQYVVQWSTSLDHNLNTCGIDETSSSPTENDNWDYRVVYDAWVDLELFNEAQTTFAYAAVDTLHCSPSKVAGINEFFFQFQDCPPCSFQSPPDPCDTECVPCTDTCYEFNGVTNEFQGDLCSPCVDCIVEQCNGRYVVKEFTFIDPQTGETVTEMRPDLCDCEVCISPVPECTCNVNANQTYSNVGQPTSTDDICEKNCVDCPDPQCDPRFGSDYDTNDNCVPAAPDWCKPCIECFPLECPLNQYHPFKPAFWWADVNDVIAERSEGPNGENLCDCIPCPALDANSTAIAELDPLTQIDFIETCPAGTRRIDGCYNKTTGSQNQFAPDAPGCEEDRCKGCEPCVSLSNADCSAPGKRLCEDICSNSCCDCDPLETIEFCDPGYYVDPANPCVCKACECEDWEVLTIITNTTGLDVTSESVMCPCSDCLEEDTVGSCPSDKPFFIVQNTLNQKHCACWGCGSEELYNYNNTIGFTTLKSASNVAWLEWCDPEAKNITANKCGCDTCTDFCCTTKYDCGDPNYFAYNDALTALDDKSCAESCGDSACCECVLTNTTCSPDVAPRTYANLEDCQCQPCGVHPDFPAFQNTNEFAPNYCNPLTQLVSADKCGCEPCAGGCCGSRFDCFNNPNKNLTGNWIYDIEVSAACNETCGDISCCTCVEPSSCPRNQYFYENDTICDCLPCGEHPDHPAFQDTDPGATATYCDPDLGDIIDGNCTCRPCLNEEDGNQWTCCHERFDCFERLGGGWIFNVAIPDCGTNTTNDCVCPLTAASCNNITEVFNATSCACEPCVDPLTPCDPVLGLTQDLEQTCLCKNCTCDPTELEDGLLRWEITPGDPCQCRECIHDCQYPNLLNASFPCQPCIDCCLQPGVDCNKCQKNFRPVAFHPPGSIDKNGVNVTGLPDLCQGCERCCPAEPDCSEDITGYNGLVPRLVSEDLCDESGGHVSDACCKPCTNRTCAADQYHPEWESGVGPYNTTTNYCVCLDCVWDDADLCLAANNETYPSREDNPEELCNKTCIPCVQRECPNDYDWTPANSTCLPCVLCDPDCQVNQRPNQLGLCFPCTNCTLSEQDPDRCPLGQWPSSWLIQPNLTANPDPYVTGTPDRCGGCQTCVTVDCPDDLDYFPQEDRCLPCLRCPTFSCPPGLIANLTAGLCKLQCDPCDPAVHSFTCTDGNPFNADIHNLIEDENGGCKCEPCSDECGIGEELVDPSKPCLGCWNCPTNCPPGEVVDPDTRCGCVGCVPNPEPPAWDGNWTSYCASQLDADGNPQEVEPTTGCACVPCTDCGTIVVTNCPTEDDASWLACCQAQFDSNADSEDFDPNAVACPSDPNCVCPCLGQDCCPPEQPADVCGVCGGDGQSCLDCAGTIGGEVYFDVCGIKCGDGSGCNQYCANSEYCSVCIAAVDLCGVCGGNSTTCYGCDGVPASLLEYDDCGICGGNNDTCWGGSNDETEAIIGVVVAAIIAAVGSVVAAAIIMRIRKRPDLLMSEWDQLIDSELQTLQENPLATEGSTDHNVLFGLDEIGDALE